MSQIIFINLAISRYCFSILLCTFYFSLPLHLLRVGDIVTDQDALALMLMPHR